MIVEKEIDMFDELLDDDPYLKERDKRVAEKAAAEAATQALQRTAVDVVGRRFPTLISLAEQRINKISSVDLLQELIGMIAAAPDEGTARFLLNPSAA